MVCGCVQVVVYGVASVSLFMYLSALTTYCTYLPTCMFTILLTGGDDNYLKWREAHQKLLNAPDPDLGNMKWMNNVGAGQE